MKTILFIIPFLFTSLHPNLSDKTPADVEEVIIRLFDAMRESDRDKAANTFHESMTLSTVVNRNGEMALAQTDMNGFLDAVGQPKDEVWDEQISGLQIHIDGELATAWMKYSFYRGEVFSHCGVNTMNLMRTQAGWKIFSITDTRRNSDC
jgi:hypothetical protein